VKSKADILILASVIAAIIAAIVSIGQVDILKLAGTQLILISIALGIYGVYLQLRG